MRQLTPFLVLALAGCPDSGTETGTTGETGGDTDETDVPIVAFDPATDITVSWSAQSVTVSLTNTDATGFYLGMAETASGTAGWYGEDCLDNDCHQATGLTLTLSSVNSLGDIVPGSTTLFDDDGDGAGDAFTSGDEDRLTYLVQTIGGTDPGDAACYIWGDDPTYYSGENCTEL